MSKSSDVKRPPSECPVCGAEIPPNAHACPQCGADERTGWNEESTLYDGLNLPDDSFDYEEALEDEGVKKRAVPKGVSIFWWAVGIGLIVLFVYLAFRA